MGLFSELRTIKRTVTGDLHRDYETITAPAYIFFDFGNGSIDDLRIAVADRLRLESEREDDYVREIHHDLNATENGQVVLETSNMAAKAVTTGDWRPMAEFAERVAHNHWLVRELAPAA